MADEGERVILDYETRSTIDLSLTGAIIYAKHPTTSIFCLGYKLGNEACRLWIPERHPSIPHDLHAALQRGAILVAHNAGFERAITKYVLPRYLPPKEAEWVRNIPASQWRCTAAKAASCSLPRSLEMAAQVIGLTSQKDMEGSRLIKKYSKPRKPSKNNPKTWWDDKQKLRHIYRYCLIDVKTEYELDQALPDLIDYEQTVWELDQRINDRGITIDISTVKIILGMIKEEISNITQEVDAMTEGDIHSPTQRAKVLEWVNARGANLVDLKAPTIRDRLLDKDISLEVRRMLECRQACSKTSTAKYIAMTHAVDEDMRAKELFRYCGADVTGRWSGNRIPQNFPRSTVQGFNSDAAIDLIKRDGLTGIQHQYGKARVMDVLVSAIRGMLIASPGKEFFCGDFAAVEARLAFWIAEHKDGIQAFKDNRKLYEEMASVAFEIPIEEIEKDSLERFVGKESVLGCQYGLGPDRFMVQCHDKGMKSVTLEIAKKAVYTYRKVHKPVPDTWKRLENSIMMAIQFPGNVYKHNKVVISVKNDFLTIRLPSGRRLRYFKPHLTQKQLAGGRMVPQINHYAMNGVTRQWERTVSWGGVFFNNIVQGTARDLLAHSLFNVENAGYDVVGHYHDEILAERKIGKGDLNEFINLMAGRLPKWAQGAPISAAGWTGLRYKK